MTASISYILYFVILIFLVINTESSDLNEACKDNKNQTDQSINESSIEVSTLLSDLREEFELNVADNKLINFFLSSESDLISPYILRKRALLYAISFSWLFKDLNNIIWYYPNIDDDDDMKLYKQLINDHCAEDGSHWKMYIYDWKKLGLNDGATTPIQTVEFFFSELTEMSRAAVYDIIYYDGLINGKENVLGRYIILSTIEIAGHHLFNAIEKDYVKYLNETNNYYLRYVGKMHSDLEQGTIHSKHHNENVDTADKIFGSIKITQNQYNKYKNICRKILYSISEKHWIAKYQFVKNKFQNQLYFNNLLY